MLNVIIMIPLTETQDENQQHHTYFIHSKLFAWHVLEFSLLICEAFRIVIEMPTADPSFQPFLLKSFVKRVDSMNFSLWQTF